MNYVPYSPCGCALTIIVIMTKLKLIMIPLLVINYNNIILPTLEFVWMETTWSRSSVHSIGLSTALSIVRTDGHISVVIGESTRK